MFLPCSQLRRHSGGTCNWRACATTEVNLSPAARERVGKWCSQYQSVFLENKKPSSQRHREGLQSKVKCVPYPGTLASYQLIIFCLDACPASDIEVLCLKVRVIQFLGGLPPTQRSQVRHNPGPLGPMYEHPEFWIFMCHVPDSSGE